MSSVLPSLKTDHSISKHVISLIIKNKTFPWPLNSSQLLPHVSAPLTAKLLKDPAFLVVSNSSPSLSWPHADQAFIPTTPPKAPVKDSMTCTFLANSSFLVWISCYLSTELPHFSLKHFLFLVLVSRQWPLGLLCYSSARPPVTGGSQFLHLFFCIDIPQESSWGLTA